jgi:predicted  nucleic acid-binding Zn-ribbon protein
MSKSNKVYNKQYKDIKEVEAKITRTDNNHTSLKDANFMLDVRIPVKNRKITLNDVVDMMLNGFKSIREDIHDLKVRVTNLENTIVDIKADISNIKTDIDNIVKLNNLRTE